MKQRFRLICGLLSPGCDIRWLTHGQWHTRCSRCHPLRRRYDTPLVADIHFQPNVAMMVADAFEKIRINPGAHRQWRPKLRGGCHPDIAMLGHVAARCFSHTSGQQTRHLTQPAGNFADGRKTFDVINYDDPAQFEAEREYIRWALASAILDLKCH